MHTIKGFVRSNGKVGVRNYLAIIPTVFCANEVAQDIATAGDMCRPILHNKGCGQLKPDLETITRTLIGLGLNPNVGGVILVSLGCEAVSADEVYRELVSQGQIVERVEIHKQGGMENAVRKGREYAKDMLERLSRQKRQEQPIENLTVAVKCGSSDATSGLAANPATGQMVDRLVDLGATAIFGETTEFIGAEHILSQRGADEGVRQNILEITERMEKRVVDLGLDMRGTQPSPGNVAGGLTTIEEKSLGAISKGGSRPVKGVLQYAERPNGPGLFIMDSPGKEDEFLTGAAAAGAGVIVFTTGGGAPQGFPLVPVIKVAANPEKVALMSGHVDVDAGRIITGSRTIKQVGEEITEWVYEVASGREVAAERQKYDRSVGIYTLGPTV